MRQALFDSVSRLAAIRGSCGEFVFHARRTRFLGGQYIVSAPSDVATKRASVVSSAMPNGSLFLVEVNHLAPASASPPKQTSANVAIACSWTLPPEN